MPPSAVRDAGGSADDGRRDAEGGEDGGGAGHGVRYAPVSDPDGNLWMLQEMAWRTGESF